MLKMPTINYRNCNMNGDWLSFIRVTNKDGRKRSVSDACNLPVSVDAAQIKVSGGLYDLTLLAAPEHFHMLLDIGFDIYDILRVADEILDLFILDIDFAVPRIPLARRISLYVPQGFGILGEILV